MGVKRVCMVSIHGDPLEELGSEEAGGQCLYVKELAIALSKLGISVDVYTRKYGGKESISRICEGARVIRLPCGPEYTIKKEELYLYLEDFLENYFDFVKKNKLRYDVIHGHYWLSGTVCVDISRRLQIPHVQTFHSLGKLKKAVLPRERDYNYAIRIMNEERIMKNCCTIVVESNAEKEHITEYYGIGEDKLHIVPGGASERFRPTEKRLARKKLGISANKVVLYLGRLTPRKGPRYLVEAIPEIYGKTDDAAFYFVGGNKKANLSKKSFEYKERRVMEKITARENLEDRCVFTGPVSDEEVPLYYSAADVIVIPSLYEPFGLVAVEALSCGTPVVATDLGGLADTVDDGINGFLVPPKDSKSIAKKVIKLLNDADLRRRFSANAIKKIEGSYSWNSIAKNILKLYKSGEFVREKPKRYSKNIMFIADLDGTLVGEAPGKISEFMENLRRVFAEKDVRLDIVYITNRSLSLKDSSFKLINECELPWPDYLIAAVGTEIYKFDGYFKCDRGWNNLQSANWNYDDIASLHIGGLKGVNMQSFNQPYKISFNLRHAQDLHTLEGVKNMLIDKDVKIIFSQDELIDIIPKTAGKGAATEYLAKKLGIPKKDVIVFGDDGSDLDMFIVGFGYNVLIGTARKPIREKFKKIYTGAKYVTKGPCEEGVIEGTLQFISELLAKPSPVPRDLKI